MFRLLISFLLLVFISTIPSSLRAETGNAWPLPEYYHNLDKIWNEIRALDSKYPDLVHWEILGTTEHDHLPIYAVKLSVNADVQRDSVPAVLFVGQHHGEEIIGVEIVMNEINHLLSNFGIDPFVTSILENNEVWFVPTVNPEGYNFVSRSYYPFRRKNNTDTNYNGRLDLEGGGDGVDLNKSYDFNWDNDAGTDPEDYYYKGPSPASEAETVAMQNFFQREKFQYAIMYHSSITGNFGERIFYAWNWGGRKSPDYDDMKEFALRFAEKLPRDYVKGNYRVQTNYTSPIGFARDYIYANYGTFSYDVECGGINLEGISIVRPFKPMYDTILDKHYNAFLEFFKEIQDYTFRGRLLDKEGNPVADASITYPTRHSVYQRAIKTNSSGYFFKYVNGIDLPFRVNLKHNFTIKKTLHTADFTLPFAPEPEFTNKNNEGLLFNEALSSFSFPRIVHSNLVSKLEMNLFDEQQWIASRTQSIQKDSVTWNIPELARLKHGELKAYLFHNWRITDQNSNEILVPFSTQSTLSWYQETSGINGYWLYPSMSIGVKYEFNGDSANLRLKGIRLYGNPGDIVFHMIIYDNKGKAVVDKEFTTDKKENDITCSFPAIEMTKTTFISLENLSTSPWKIMTESSIYPCSHQNYVRFDDWQKIDIPDFGIELIIEK